MPAKPIIDIAIGLENLSDQVIESIKSAFEKTGFVYKSNEGEEGGYLFIQQKSSDIITHHLHIVRKDEQQWSNYLAFRDTLRNNSAIAETYQKLKRDLAQQYPTNRLKYTYGKDEFIRSII